MGLFFERQSFAALSFIFFIRSARSFSAMPDLCIRTLPFSVRTSFTVSYSIKITSAYKEYAQGSGRIIVWNTKKELFDMPKIIMYLRKSRADGEGSISEVLQRHERILQEFYQKQYGEPLPQSCIYREIQSGETIADRPVMQYIIDLVQGQKVSGILVIEPQRLSRGDLADTGTLSRLFMYTGVPVITPQKTYDLTDKFDRKFFEMELMRGNDYLEYTKEILLRGRLASVKEGNYIGSVPPYGYSRAEINSKPTLIPNPTEAETVRSVFVMYAQNQYSPAEISRCLNQSGICPRHSVKWSSSTIREMLKNPVYIGMIQWNKRKVKKTYRNGEIIETRPRSRDVLLTQGRHEPIVPLELFNTVQNRMKEKMPLPVKKSCKIRNPLAGILYCICGRAMVYKQAENDAYMVCPAGCGCRGAKLTHIMALIKAGIIEAFPSDDIACLVDSYRADAAETNAFLKELISTVRYQRQKSSHGRWGETAIELDIFFAL